MGKVTTVKGKSGRRYEVRAQLFGTRSLVYYLYYGEVFLSSTLARGDIADAIKAADEKAEEIGIELTGK